MFIHLLSNTRIKVHFLVILFVELCSIEMCSKLFQLYRLQIFVGMFASEGMLVEGSVNGHPLNARGLLGF